MKAQHRYIPAGSQASELTMVLPLPENRLRRRMLAFIALAAAAALAIAALSLPPIVHGQSKTTLAPAAPATNTQVAMTHYGKSDKAQNSLEARARKANEARMTEAERQRLREQIIEASKRGSKSALVAVPKKASTP